MDRNWTTRVSIIALVTLGCFYALVPTYYSYFVLDKADRNNLTKLDQALPGWAPSAATRLSLGLDLQGGIHMVMRVDTKTALQKRAERRGLQMVSFIKSKKLGDLTMTSDPEKREVTVTAADAAAMDAIEKELKTTFDDFSVVNRSGAALTLRLEQVDYFMNDAVEQAMLVIRKRIDKWGVAEVDVRRLGNDSIQISLPGRQDPEQAKELVGTTAQLEFRLIEESPTNTKEFFEKTPPDAAAAITLVTTLKGESNEPPVPYLESKNREALLEYLKDKAPTDKQYLLHCVESENGKDCTSYQTYLAEKVAGVTGDTLTGAEARQNSTTNEVEVNFELDAAGASAMGELTGKNVNKRMAVVLDDNVLMAPTIQSKIEGSGRITLGRKGNLDERLAEAKMLSLALKAGALPAPVTAGEIRQVGASLGDELIKKGVYAAVVGLALVVLFMALYYKLSGLIADVALVLNGLMILAGLTMFSATLTLPGIAGFVLTLGIAVDANVLINERVREELRNGKSAKTAVDQGYDRAFWTIFDAHVTTLIAGAILWFTGTGPIRGFATTLIVGIVASLFTSIVVTRTITTYVVHHRNAETVSV